MLSLCRPAKVNLALLFLSRTHINETSGRATLHSSVVSLPQRRNSTRTWSVLAIRELITASFEVARMLFCVMVILTALSPSVFWLL